MWLHVLVCTCCNFHLVTANGLWFQPLLPLMFHHLLHKDPIWSPSKLLNLYSYLRITCIKLFRLTTTRKKNWILLSLGRPTKHNNRTFFIEIPKPKMQQKRITLFDKYMVFPGAVYWLLSDSLLIHGLGWFYRPFSDLLCTIIEWS